MRTIPRRPRSLVLLVPLSGLLLAPSAHGQSQDRAVRVSNNQAVVVDDIEAVPVRGLDIPGLAADPSDSDHLVLVAEDLLAGECTFRVTFDGGATWAGGVLEAPEGFQDPPCVGFDSGGYTHTDGSVAFGSDQNVYTTFSSVREGQGDSVLVARSIDGGRTFETATVAIPGGVERSAEGDIGPVNQRPKLAVEALPEGDRIYVSAWGGTYLDIEDVPGCGGPCGYRVVTAVSDDGGATWAEPVDATAPRTPEELVATAPLDIAREQSQPAVAPDGEVFVAWRARFDTETGEDRLMVGASSDGGMTWTRRVVGGDDELITGLGHPKMAVGPEGTVYVAYQADASTEEDADSEVFLRRSTNAGVSWSEPVRINDDPPGQDVAQSIPQVAVAPDGRVDLVWHDGRHAYPGPAESNDIYYASSPDQGASISPNQRMTDRTINLDVGLDARVGTTSFYHPALAPRGDGSTMVAWADPRLGSFLDGSQDIFFATAVGAASGPAPVEALEAVTETGDVALSRLAYPGGNQRVDGQAATKIVVVGEADTPGALAGSVLARANHGPVLVAGSAGLAEVVEDEVSRLDPSEVFLIGDEDRVPAEVVADLVDLGVPEEAIERLQGDDDAAMAAAVARAVAESPRLSTDELEDLAEEGGSSPTIEEAVIVNPDDPGAAAAAALAAALRFPVLFASPDEVPTPTTEALASFPVQRTLVVGDASSIGDGVLAALPSPSRVGGDDAATMAQAVAAEAVARGLPTNLVYLADTERPFAAAVTAASVARLGGLLLLEPGAEPDAVDARLDDLALDSPVDRIVVVQPASSSTNWLLIVLAVVFAVAGAAFLVFVRRRSSEGRSRTGRATA